MIDHRVIPEPDRLGIRWYQDGSRIVPDGLGHDAIRSDNHRVRSMTLTGSWPTVGDAAAALHADALRRSKATEP
jgi:hypothetical protein